jgi:Zinc-binding dehydrogenase
MGGVDQASRSVGVTIDHARAKLGGRWEPRDEIDSLRAIIDTQNEIAAACEDGDLPHVRITNSIRVRPKDLEEFIVARLDATVRPMGLLSYRIRIGAKRHRVSYSFLFMRASGDQLRQITPLIESRAVRPVVDRVFPFESINDAMAYVETGRAKGKVVVRMK